eukprot:TRINITY_DN1215_c0_g2_i10.p12 TRINITY_DN1215_c0_g2~~TRINITY_DN1215_c0_g2_i10.p12  ORF type:complete len:104 (+),score=6.98 TRINITY_DN1215_c0_g2_i10:737-1048(+)
MMFVFRFGQFEHDLNQIMVEIRLQVFLMGGGGYLFGNDIQEVYRHFLSPSQLTKRCQSDAHFIKQNFYLKLRNLNSKLVVVIIFFKDIQFWRGSGLDFYLIQN